MKKVQPWFVSSLAASSLLLAPDAYANNDLTATYRPGSIEMPGISGAEANNPSAVSAAQGGVSYSIPLPALPGHPSLPVQLNLQYSGQRSESVVGLGWTLSVPSIRAKASGRKGQPIYEPYTILVAGAPATVARRVTYVSLEGEDLVEVAATGPMAAGDVEYRAERDRRHIRYIKLGAGGFRLDYPDGTQAFFGQSDATRVQRAQTTGEAWAAEWLLEKLVDRSGNEVTYTWSTSSAAVAGSTSTSARYLTEVRLGCASACATATSYQKLRFSYVSRSGLGAPIARSSRNGFLVETENALSAVAASTVRNGTATAVRQSEFGYGVQQGRLMLTSARTRGADGSLAPLMQFSYSSAAAPIADSVVPAGDRPGVSFADGIVPLDVDLDGHIDIADLSAVGARLNWYRNAGATRFETSRAVPLNDRPAVSLTSAGISAEDSNQDVSVDVVDLGAARAYPMIAPGRWNRAGEINDQAAAGRFTDYLRVDVDQDGRVDAVNTSYLGGQWRIMLNDRQPTRDDSFSVTMPPGKTAATSGLLLGEVSADGIEDVIVITGPTAQVYFGKGRYGWGYEPADAKPATYESFAVASPPTNLDALRMADLNADGLDDLVSIDSNAGVVSVWFFDPSLGFSAKQSFAIPNSAANNCRLADFDADGAREILCSNGWHLLDFANQAPLLLASVQNGLGLTTTLSYDTTAQYARRHAAAGNPFASNIAAAIRVVSKIETHDTTGTLLVTNYDYRDPFYKVDDVLDRHEFVGFGYVSEASTPYLVDAAGARFVDPLDPGSLRRTFYNVGASNWNLRGEAVCEELYPTGTTFGPTELTCGTKPGALKRTINEYTSPVARGIAQVHLDARNEFVLEGATSGAHLRTEYQYDAFGNVRTQIAYGEVIDANMDGRISVAEGLAGNDEQMTQTEYAIDSTRWMTRLVSHIERGAVQVFGGAAALVKEAEAFNFYDGSASWSAPVLTRGLVTRTQSWLHDPITGTSSTVTNMQSTYTAKGLPDLVTNAEGTVTDYDYDTTFGLFAKKQTVDATGLRLITTMDIDPANGKTTRLTGPDGQSTRAAYDGLGRITKIAKPGDSLASPSMTRSYLVGTPTRITDSAKDGTINGLVTLSTLDGRGQPVCTRSESNSANYNVTQALYSARGSKVMSLLPYSAANCDVVSLVGGVRATGRNRAETQVDALSRATRTTNLPSGDWTQIAYGPLTTTAWDAEDTHAASAHYETPKTTVSDGRGRTVSVTEELDSDGDGIAEPYTTEFTYTALDALESVTDVLGTTIYEAVYDTLGRTRQSTDADRGTITTSYDVMNRVATTTDARGEAVTYTYDRAGRVKTAVSSDGTSTYNYDALRAGVVGCTAAYAKGRLGWVSDPSGYQAFCYDNRGRQIRTEQQINSYGARVFKTRSSFDSLDRVVTLTHPDNTTLTYTYGRAGFQDSARLSGGALAAAITLASNPVYEATGQLRSVRLGNGVVVSKEYDSRGRPMRDRAKRAGTTLLNLRLEIDRASNVTGVIDEAFGALTASYVYDDFYRLTSSQGARFGGESAAYSYDARSNLTSKTFSDAASELNVGTLTYRTDLIHAVDQARGETFSYDAAGNLEDDGIHSYEYTAFGMLGNVVSAGATDLSLVYDYANRRVAKSIASGAKTFYLAAASAELSRTAAGVESLDKDVSFAGLRIARFEDTLAPGQALRYFVNDHLGSPTLVLDTAGNIVERWASHPFGEENDLAYAAYDATHATRWSDQYFEPGDANSNLTKRFQGRSLDAETGFYDFGARVYRPDLGRFMSADSEVPYTDSSQSWNRYAFVRNNPLSAIDPTGHADCLAAEFLCVDVDAEGQSVSLSLFHGEDTSRDGSITTVDLYRVEVGGLFGSDGVGLEGSAQMAHIEHKNTTGGTTTLDVVGASGALGVGPGTGREEILAAALTITRSQETPRGVGMLPLTSVEASVVLGGFGEELSLKFLPDGVEVGGMFAAGAGGGVSVTTGNVTPATPPPSGAGSSPEPAQASPLETCDPNEL